MISHGFVVILQHFEDNILPSFLASVTNLQKLALNLIPGAFKENHFWKNTLLAVVCLLLSSDEGEDRILGLALESFWILVSVCYCLCKT